MSSAELIDVTKRFGKVTALDGVSLTVEKGEFLSIVGPSGCGKTTLLRLIAGFELPTEGTVRVRGTDVSSPSSAVPPEHRDIGMVFQTFALWPHMKVADQIRFPLDHRKHLPDDVAADKEGRVTEVLRLTGLEEYRDRYPSELSGGQQQRVGLARAIAPKPSLLLMDEPLSALDAELREELRREIQTLHQVTEVAIVYVTHDQSEALSMSDRVVVMRNGRIEQLDTPQKIYRHPTTEFVARFVGRANLMPGKWDGDRFIPDAGEGLSWEFGEVAEEFREKGICPIRPEQLEIARTGDGIPGTVRNSLFNGREHHYTVEVPGAALQVYMSTGPEYEVGDQVVVNARRDGVPQ